MRACAYRGAVALLLCTANMIGAADPVPIPKGTACVPAWFNIPGSEHMDSSTFSAVRASDGFLYLGGREGLYRIEGSGVTRFLASPNDDDQLPAGHVRALAADDTGLWVGHAAGLSWFDIQQRTFETVLFSPSGEPSKVYSLLLYEGLLYIGHENGGAIIDADSRELLGEFSTGGTGSRGRVYDLKPFRDSVVAISSHAVFTVAANSETGALGTEREADLRLTGFNAAISQSGDLWMVTKRSQLVHVPADASKDAERFTREELPGLPTDSMNYVAFDASNTLWIASVSQLSRWRPGDAYPASCRTSAIGRSSGAVSIAMFYTDLNGDLIVGSRGRAPRFIKSTPDVRRFAPNTPSQTGIPDESVWSVATDTSGRVLIGTLQGLYRETQPGSDAFEAIAPDVLGDLRIYALRRERDDAWWVGTNRGVYYHDESGTRQMRDFVMQDGSPKTEVTYFLEFVGDKILAATGGGVTVFDRETFELELVYQSDDGKVGVSEAPVIPTGDPSFYHVNVIGDDVFAVGDRAVYRLDLESRTIAASTLFDRANDKRLQGKYYAVAPTADGKVYVATESGVLATDRDFKDYELIDQVDGERIGAQLSAETHEDGTVWFAGAAGVLRLDPNDQSWRRFTVADGLHATRTTQNALTLTEQGWAMTSSGSSASLFQPASIRGIVPGAPEITRITSGDEAIRISAAGLFVGPTSRDLTMSFASRDLQLQPGVRIDYQFADDTNRTVLTGGIELDEQLVFPRLSPGTYRFSARISQPTGVSSSVNEQTIVVRSFWWETNFAKSAAIAAFFGLITLTYLWNIRRLRRRYKLIGDERKRIAQDFHDTFMQEVFGALMISRALPDAPGADDAKPKLVSLLEAAARSARASVNELNATSKLPPLAEALQTHDPARFVGRDGDLVSVNETGAPWRLRTDRVFFVSRIAKEAMTNAAKHAQASQIDVHIRWRSLDMSVEVIDNGIGFDRHAAQSRRTFGLASMTRMAKACRARLEISSRPEAGTRVVITVGRFW
ncbi:MAG: ATP-binding protein [Pseudomonadota bacterium]